MAVWPDARGVRSYAGGLYPSRAVRFSPEVRARAERYGWILTLHDRDDRVGDQFWLCACACQKAGGDKTRTYRAGICWRTKDTRTGLQTLFTHFPDRMGIEPAGYSASRVDK